MKNIIFYDNNAFSIKIKGIVADIFTPSTTQFLSDKTTIPQETKCNYCLFIVGTNKSFKIVLDVIKNTEARKYVLVLKDSVFNTLVERIKAMTSVQKKSITIVNSGDILKLREDDTIFLGDSKLIYLLETLKKHRTFIYSKSYFYLPISDQSFAKNLLVVCSSPSFENKILTIRGEEIATNYLYKLILSNNRKKKGEEQKSIKTRRPLLSVMGFRRGGSVGIKKSGIKKVAAVCNEHSNVNQQHLLVGDIQAKKKLYYYLKNELPQKNSNIFERAFFYLKYRKKFELKKIKILFIKTSFLVIILFIFFPWIFLIFNMAIYFTGNGFEERGVNPVAQKLYSINKSLSVFYANNNYIFGKIYKNINLYQESQLCVNYFDFKNDINLSKTNKKIHFEKFVKELFSQVSITESKTVDNVSVIMAENNYLLSKFISAQKGDSCFFVRNKEVFEDYKAQTMLLKNENSLIGSVGRENDLLGLKNKAQYLVLIKNTDFYTSNKGLLESVFLVDVKGGRVGNVKQVEISDDLFQKEYLFITTQDQMNERLREFMEDKNQGEVKLKGVVSIQSYGKSMVAYENIRKDLLSLILKRKNLDLYFYDADLQKKAKYLSGENYLNDFCFSDNCYTDNIQIRPVGNVNNVELKDVEIQISIEEKLIKRKTLFSIENKTAVTKEIEVDLRYNPGTQHYFPVLESSNGQKLDGNIYSEKHPEYQRMLIKLNLPANSISKLEIILVGESGIVYKNEGEMFFSYNEFWPGPQTNIKLLVNSNTSEALSNGELQPLTDEGTFGYNGELVYNKTFRINWKNEKISN